MWNMYMGCRLPIFYGFAPFGSFRSEFEEEKCFGAHTLEPNRYCAASGIEIRIKASNRRLVVVSESRQTPARTISESIIPLRPSQAPRRIPPHSHPSLILSTPSRIPSSSTLTSPPPPTAPNAPHNTPLPPSRPNTAPPSTTTTSLRGSNKLGGRKFQSGPEGPPDYGPHGGDAVFLCDHDGCDLVCEEEEGVSEK